MSPAEEAAAEAHDAIAAAIGQLGQQMAAPLARIDHEARAGYLELHTQTVAITQRLANEVGAGIYQAQALHAGIAANIADFHAPQLAALAAPINAVAARVHNTIGAAITSYGR